MRRPTDEQLAAWAADTRRVRFERRNWPVVRRLAAICVVLLIMGLAAYILAQPFALVVVCGAGALVAAVLMLVWFLDSRRFRTRPPDRF